MELRVTVGSVQWGDSEGTVLGGSGALPALLCHPARPGLWIPLLWDWDLPRGMEVLDPFLPHGR